jgi:hypothetical protein
MSWTQPPLPGVPAPTPEAEVFLTTIANAVNDPAKGALPAVQQYVLDHIDRCRRDQDHPYLPPPILHCAAGPTGATHANRPEAALVATLSLAAAQASKPAPDWCIIVFTLDHAGGGGIHGKPGHRSNLKTAPGGNLKPVPDGK